MMTPPRSGLRPLGADQGGTQPPVSAGVWRTAWRRFKNDRVGRVAGVVVLAFLLLIAAAGAGLLAADWQRELAVANAPPTLLGPRTAKMRA